MTNIPDIDKKLSIGFVAQACSIFILTLYTLGFVVVNAHLAHYSAHSFDMFKIQYLAAGFTLCVVFGIYAFLVGKRVYHAEEDAVKLAKLAEGHYWHPFWALFANVFIHVETIFSIVLATYWVANMMFENVTGRIPFTIGISIFFLLDYLILWRADISSRYPFVALPIMFVGFLASTIAGFWLLKDPRVLFLILYFFVVTTVLKFVLDTISIHAKNALFKVFWVIVSILVATSTFGGMFYGEIKSSVGGGKPERARIVLAANLPASISLLLGAVDRTSKITTIYGESSDYVFIGVKETDKEDERMLRLRKDQVVAVIPEPNK